MSNKAGSTKLDFKKELAHLYNPSPKEVVLVDVPAMNFLMVDGSGDPNMAQEYKDALEALYGASFTLKFMLKKEQGIDYTVPPLEGLWWTDDPAEFSMVRKDLWSWTMMIMQPEYVTNEVLNRALEQVKQNKDASPSLSKLRFERFQEGLSAQIMHIGPYAAEGPTVEKLHTFIKEHGYQLSRKHHEIYLGDPRRSAPEKLKTVIRQPVKP